MIVTVMKEFGLCIPAPIASRAFRAIHMGVSMTQDVLPCCATTSFNLVTVWAREISQGNVQRYGVTVLSVPWTGTKGETF